MERDINGVIIGKLGKKYIVNFIGGLFPKRLVQHQEGVLFPTLLGARQSIPTRPFMKFPFKIHIRLNMEVIEL